MAHVREYFLHPVNECDPETLSVLATYFRVGSQTISQLLLLVTAFSLRRDKIH